MKSFSNIQELWDYCLFCPICQKTNRAMNISVGPDQFWDSEDFVKEKEHIIVYSTYKTSKHARYFIDIKINCFDNTFRVNLSGDNPYPLRDEIGKIIQKEYIFLDINGVCELCKCSCISSQALELDTKTQKIFNIEIEREKYYLLREKDKYCVTLWHDTNTMQVSKYNSNLLEEGKEIDLPLATLDLTDQAKVIEKLKTLILFS